MYNDTHLNVLISYAYLYGQQSFMDYVKKCVLSGKINLMIDSGAFTKHNSKSKMSHVNVKDYCDFLKEWQHYCEKYVMLDVVGKAEQSKKNYEYMLSQGLNPMFVATMFDKDFDYIRKAVDRNPNICVAGGVTTKSDWMTKRFQDIYKETKGKAQIHGLGYVTFPKMLQLNLKSVDASTWKTAPARFGQTVFFSEWEKRTYRVLSRDVVSGKFKLPQELRMQLHDLGITPQMFVENRTKRGEQSIEFFLSCYNNIKWQRYCKRHGLDYYLAVGSLRDLEMLIYVDDNWKTISYNKFLKHFT